MNFGNATANSGSEPPPISTTMNQTAVDGNAASTETPASARMAWTPVKGVSSEPGQGWEIARCISREIINIDSVLHDRDLEECGLSLSGRLLFGQMLTERFKPRNLPEKFAICSRTLAEIDSAADGYWRMQEEWVEETNHHSTPQNERPEPVVNDSGADGRGTQQNLDWTSMTADVAGEAGERNASQDSRQRFMLNIVPMDQAEIDGLKLQRLWARGNNATLGLQLYGLKQEYEEIQIDYDEAKFNHQISSEPGSTFVDACQEAYFRRFQMRIYHRADSIRKSTSDGGVRDIVEMWLEEIRVYIERERNWIEERLREDAASRRARGQDPAAAGSTRRGQGSARNGRNDHESGDQGGSTSGPDERGDSNGPNGYQCRSRKKKNKRRRGRGNDGDNGNGTGRAEDDGGGAGRGGNRDDSERPAPTAPPASGPRGPNPFTGGDLTAARAARDATRASGTNRADPATGNANRGGQGGGRNQPRPRGNGRGGPQRGGGGKRGQPDGGRAPGGRNQGSQNGGSGGRGEASNAPHGGAGGGGSEFID